MHKTLSIFIALVWLVMGLIFKVLKLSDRHEQIVGRILGSEYASIFTTLIGISEIFMAIWILSGIKSRLCATTQILLIITMNIIEFTLAPDLLLWGQFNIIFALLFVVIIYYNEFVLKPKS